VIGIPSRITRIPRTPNVDLAPNPRIESRGSCDGLFRFTAVTPGISASVSSAAVFRNPGRALSGDETVIAKGDERTLLPDPRVTVTTTGLSVVAGTLSVCAAASHGRAIKPINRNETNDRLRLTSDDHCLT
jgi:hypothetical protein